MDENEDFRDNDLPDKCLKCNQIELTTKIAEYRSWLKWAKEHPDRWNNSAPSRECIWEKFVEVFGEEQTNSGKPT